jgi:hypothetical protein
VNPDKFGQSKVLVRDNHHYGKQEQVYDGFNIWTNMRFHKALTVQGGFSAGRTRTEACYVIDSPEALRFCEITPPMLKSGSVVASYLLPKGFGLSATYRDYPGVQITANWVVPNSLIQPSLGRPLSSGINGTPRSIWCSPGRCTRTAAGARLRFSKRHSFKGVVTRDGEHRRVQHLQFDGHRRVEQHYGPSWQRPTLLQGARFVKLSAQFDF